LYNACAASIIVGVGLYEDSCQFLALIFVVPFSEKQRDKTLYKFSLFAG